MKKYIFNIFAIVMVSALLCGCGGAASEGEEQPGTIQEAETEMVSDDVNLEEGNVGATDQSTGTGQAPEQASDDPEEELLEEEPQGGETAPAEDEVTWQKKDESPATGYMVGDHDRTFEGIKEYLGAIDEEATALAGMGGIAISWNRITGMRNLVAFEERYAAGQETEIVLVQYTVEGDPIFDYLYYDGTEVWHVMDASRDMWGVPENAYMEERYPYLLHFTQKAEERDRMHSLVLSEKDGLTYEECLQKSSGNSGDVKFVASFFYTDADL